MKERVELIALYDIYKELLTDKQKLYFENYYYEDLSLSEISENLSVSKTIVGRTIKEVEKIEEKKQAGTNKLKEYEKILKVKSLYDKINELESKK